MSDFLVNLGKQPAARSIIKNLGLPTPLELSRGKGAYEATPLKGKTAILSAAPNSYATEAAAEAMEAAGADVLRGDASALAENGKADLLVFDATGCSGADDLKNLYNFYHPLMRRIKNHGRVVVLAGVPELIEDVATAVAARACEGFVRSIGKEIGKKGATANLIYVENGAESRIQGPLRFLLSSRSAYVDGQPVRVTNAASEPKAIHYTAPLKGKVALVTGGARGIGAATAKRLAEEGAQVVCLDIPQDKETLDATVKEIGGTALPMDITDADAPQKIAEFLKTKFKGVDIVIHNAGVTRDKTLANMKEQLWDMVLNINLAAILRIDEELLAKKVINSNGRIVCLSSIGGIAGNLGQTNYGATKAGLIGYVQKRSEELAKDGTVINAVAPGFIETRMTAEMPMMIREAGRRMNSLSQGGQPEDVAELITFLSTPGACGVTGNVIRVCGQSLIGA